MRLAWRDLTATAVVAAGLVLALSVTLEWGWPLMNGAREGILALVIAGVIAFSIAGWGELSVSSLGDPSAVVRATLAVIALVLAVAGLFAGAMDYVVWLMVATTLLWLVTLGDRMMAAGRRRTLTSA